MQSKLSLLALSSLAMLVTASPSLESRKNSFPSCKGQILCCTLRDPARHATRMLLANTGIDFNSATGLIGTGCTAAKTSSEDLDDYCGDNNQIACCPFGFGSTRKGCSALDD